MPRYRLRGQGLALSLLFRSAIIRAIHEVADRLQSFEKNRQEQELRTSNLRIGLGEDSHRLEEGGPLRLGGIDVPHHRQLVGHSDADVLLHAITDALLGAGALPDIGQMFPDHAEENRARDSSEMLAIASERVAELGYEIVNLDSVIHAQKPKLADYLDAMRHRIAGILRINPFQVGLKAKTGEGVGPVGLEEAIEVRCVVLLEKRGENRA